MKKTKIYAEVLEQSALDQFNEAMSLECNIQGALMPDAHTGYTLPIGAVIKSDLMVFPSYVGYDIGCGMCAIKVNVHKEELDLIQLKKDILKAVPIGFNRHKQPHAVPEFKHENTESLIENLSKVGTLQIGTLGGGNHFIELGEADFDPEIDPSGEIWIVIHSGSRGLGHKTADRYMKLAAAESIDLAEVEHEFFMCNEKLFMHNKPRYDSNLENHIEKTRVALAKNIEGHYGFDIRTELGRSYLADMNYCLDYALANRKAMIDRILEAIFKQTGTRSCGELINRNHNHAEVDKNGHVIHRKGATHAEKGMMGVIPGNMLDGSFIVKGLGNEDSMQSSSHGAGRVLSRKKAKETLSVETFNSDMKNVVTNHSADTVDEAPQAYKNIFEVMKLQKDLVEVVDRCRPFLNIKG